MAKKDLQARPPLGRMMKIHQCLMKGQFPNCSTLAKAIEVSTKTIQRDLEYMRDQLGLPLEYDAQEHGYFYTQEVTNFPTIPATEGELLALFVSQHALAQYKGTPFEQPLQSAFAKLSAVMGDEISVDPEELAKALSFRHTGVAVTDLEVFKVIRDSLLTCHELSFPYKKLTSQRAERRTVQPYHLASIDGQWYLFAMDKARRDIRTFVLARIQDVPKPGKPFEKPEDFSLTDRLMGSFGVFKGTGDFRVKIEFDAFAAQLVRERKWHESQQLKEIPGGGLQLAMRLDSLEEIERWVLSWGSHAKVLGPAQLRHRVKQALGKMNDSYAEAPPWFTELREAARAFQPDRLMQLVMAIDRQPDDPNQLHLHFADSGPRTPGRN